MKPLKEMRYPCQIEKDERFWIARSMMTIFHSLNRLERLVKIFKKAYGDSPPVDLGSWQECFDGELSLFFEPTLPSPTSYKNWLRENLKQRQFIPYILDAAYGKKHLEGPTFVDAMLLNSNNGFSVIIEAKVLSDISVQVSYDVLRNQIARNIDIILEENSDLCPPLNLRKPERTLFMLVTPKIFKDNLSSRLYGYKMNDYISNPNSIGSDLPHRKTDWNATSKRLGWVTWDDLS